MALGPAAMRDGAGTLRYRVTFAERNTTSDEYGNPSTGWVNRCTVAANIIARLGGEAVEAARLAGRQPVTIRVRKSPETARITTDWKAIDQNGTNTISGPRLIRRSGRRTVATTSTCWRKPGWRYELFGSGIADAKGQLSRMKDGATGALTSGRIYDARAGQCRQTVCFVRAVSAVAGTWDLS